MSEQNNCPECDHPIKFHTDHCLESNDSGWSCFCTRTYESLVGEKQECEQRKQHLDAMANLWLTAQDVLPKLKGCWSQNADDAHFDSEAFELIGKLRQALEKE